MIEWYEDVVYFITMKGTEEFCIEADLSLGHTANCGGVMDG